MIDTKNKFGISNFKNIVFLGHSKAFSKMQEINNKLNIKDIISELNPGDRFYTPNNKLELALSKKIIYKSEGIKK